MRKIARNKFSFLNRYNSHLNKEMYKAALHPPEFPLDKHFKPTMLKSDFPIYKISKTDSFEIIYEQSDIPSFITLIVMFKFGPRFETEKTSGFTFWVKNCIFDYLSRFPKVFSNSSIDFEREYIILKGVCMSYQTKEFLSVFAGAFKETALNVEVLQNTNFEEDQNYEPFEKFMQLSFEGSDIGNPIKGTLDNFTVDIKEFIFNCKELHSKILTKNNFVFAGSGVYNQEEFSDIIKTEFSYLSDSDFRLEMSPSKYIANSGFANIEEASEIPELYDDVNPDEPQILIGFQGIHPHDEDFIACNIFQELIGEAASFSVGGPGKNSSARAHDIMAYNSSFESVNCFNNYFSDV